MDPSVQAYGAVARQPIEDPGQRAAGVDAYVADFEGSRLGSVAGSDNSYRQPRRDRNGQADQAPTPTHGFARAWHSVSSST